MNRSQSRFFNWSCAFWPLFGMGLKGTGASKTVETERLILKGDSPKIEMMSGGKNVTTISVENGVAQIAMSDNSGQQRLQLQGGDSPAVYMRNGKGEIVGAMLMLEDGGTAVGLADGDGDIAALMRGEQIPASASLKNLVSPISLLGSQKASHTFLSHRKKEKIPQFSTVATPPPFFFADAQGNVSLFLSKDGLYQGKKEEKKEKKGPSGKIFTWDPNQNPLKS